MPSGAKKRKAAKKKLQKETKNTTNDDGSHSLGNENANKSQDERESDTGEGERESSEERVAVEVSLGERNVSEEVKSEDNYNDVKVNADDRATKNREHKKSSSSSNSSSSDDDEVAVKKDKPMVDEASKENPVSVEECIPIEESVQQTQEKIETKVIQVVDEGESLLPESSGVISAAAQCGDNHVKDSQTHKYVEEQPLVSTVPLPVRRTSWTNCCGLFEVFSGGANR